MIYFSLLKIANWARDNTPYAMEDSIGKLLEILEKDTNILLNWFEYNEMKSNSDKSHLLVVNGQEGTTMLGDQEIVGEESVKLLGVIIDNKLNFNEHVSTLCKKANQKITCIACIRNIKISKQR